MMRCFVFTLSALLLTVGAACAHPTESVPTASAPTLTTNSQPPPSTNGRIGGVVQRTDQDHVVLQGGERFSLNADALIIRSIPVDAANVRPGDFVAVTAKRQEDGTL